MSETDDIVKIIRINAYIQRGLGVVTLDGKEVLCVALDKTCATADEPEKPLTDDQLNDMFIQSFGYTKNAPTRKEASDEHIQSIPEMGNQEDRAKS